MAYNVKFDTGEISSRVGNIKSTVEEISSLLTTLTGQINSLRDSYSGTAADAFQEVYTQWQSTQGKIRDDLQGIMTGLDGTRTSREDQESALTQQWNSALG